MAEKALDQYEDIFKSLREIKYVWSDAHGKIQYINDWLKEYDNKRKRHRKFDLFDHPHASLGPNSSKIYEWYMFKKHMYNLKKEYIDRLEIEQEIAEVSEDLAFMKDNLSCIVSPYNTDYFGKSPEKVVSVYDDMCQRGESALIAIPYNNTHKEIIKIRKTNRTHLTTDLIHDYIRRFLLSILEKTNKNILFKGLGVSLSIGHTKGNLTGEICVSKGFGKVCGLGKFDDNTLDFKGFDIRLMVGAYVEAGNNQFQSIIGGGGEISISVDNDLNIKINAGVNMDFRIQYKNNSIELIKFHKNVGFSLDKEKIEPIQEDKSTIFSGIDSNYNMKFDKKNGEINIEALDQQTKIDSDKNEKKWLKQDIPDNYKIPLNQTNNKKRQITSKIEYDYKTGTISGGIVKVSLKPEGGFLNLTTNLYGLIQEVSYFNFGWYELGEYLFGLLPEEALDAIIYTIKTTDQWSDVRNGLFENELGIEDNKSAQIENPRLFNSEEDPRLFKNQEIGYSAKAKPSQININIISEKTELKQTQPGVNIVRYYLDDGAYFENANGGMEFVEQLKKSGIKIKWKLNRVMTVSANSKLNQKGIKLNRKEYYDPIILK